MAVVLTAIDNWYKDVDEDYLDKSAESSRPYEERKKDWDKKVDYLKNNILYNEVDLRDLYNEPFVIYSTGVVSTVYLAIEHLENQVSDHLKALDIDMELEDILTPEAKDNQGVVKDKDSNMNRRKTYYMNRARSYFEYLGKIDKLTVRILMRHKVHENWGDNEL